MLKFLYHLRLRKLSKRRKSIFQRNLYYKRLFCFSRFKTLEVGRRSGQLKVSKKKGICLRFTLESAESWEVMQLAEQQQNENSG